VSAGTHSDPSELVKLHGGPRHGEEHEVVPGARTVWIARQLPAAYVSRMELPPSSGLQEGRYSRVGDSSDFEWDGWQM